MKKNNFYYLECFKCREKTSEEVSSTVCPKCKNPLEVKYDFDFLKKRVNFHAIKNSPLSVQKYADLLPIKDFSKIVSLGEGNTPLLEAQNLNKELGFKNLYIKSEGSNPTGVFKDRGTLVELAKARELGAKAVCLASTGNMASSVSAYASIAKIPAYVLVPENTPAGKLTQTLVYGARILQIRGTYSECAELAEYMAHKNNFYLAGDYAFRSEGQKTLAFEICEQLYFKVPDFVICPVGCGTNLSAIYKGFKEFLKLGLIDKIPRMVACQPKACDPIVSAFKEKREDFDIIEKPETVASAVAAGNPLDGIKVLKALYESKGKAVRVSDRRILQAQRELASQESLFVEPSAAISLAALKKLKIPKSSTVVLVTTGNGLKDPKPALKVLSAPPVVEPEKEEIDRFLKFKLYNIKASKESKKSLWKTLPTEKELKEVVQDEIGIDLRNSHVKEVRENLKVFFDKGKSVKTSALKHLVEDVLRGMTEIQKTLEVLDFIVSNSKNKRAEARVEMLFEGNQISSSSQGVGPFDAIMSAIRKGIKEKEKFKIKLFDYSVKISYPGSDADVEVMMDFVDDQGNRTKSFATSPDIVVASVNAFEKGYNILAKKRG